MRLLQKRASMRECSPSRAGWLTIFALALASTAPVGISRAEVVTVNATAPAQAFPHFWEHTFGSGRAILSLRQSYRDDLRAVKAITAVGYVRFHAILHDEVGIYSEDANGKPVYNFSYVDQIYDGLLGSGVRPFVELSFMPRQLASRDVRHTFWYHPLVTPPKDYRRWDDMIEALLGRHLVERYGVAEVSRWYFEVWNEPNLEFLGGRSSSGNLPGRSMSTRLVLSRRSTAACGSGVRPRPRPPGSRISSVLPSLVRFRVDFISTHVYGDEYPEQGYLDRSAGPWRAGTSCVVRWPRCTARFRRRRARSCP